MAKKVRILVAVTLCGTALHPDDVALLPDDVAKAYAADGSVDGNKAAVDYALSINGNKTIDIVAAQAADALAAKRADFEKSLAAATDDAVKADLQAQLAALG